MEPYICQKDVQLLSGGPEAEGGDPRIPLRENGNLSVNSGFYGILGLYQEFGARLTDNGDLPLE